MTQPPPFPIVRLRPNKAPDGGPMPQPWIYADQVAMDRRTRAIAPGTLVEVQTSGREILGTWAFHPDSKIALRFLDHGVPQALGPDWISDRIRAAASVRERLYDAPFYRLIHAEADGLPGVVIDRFGDAAVIQPNAAWAEAHFEALADAVAALGVTTIVKNGQGRARKLEGLDETLDVVRGSLEGPIPVPMNGATYMADLTGGQKTGLFYDQRDNHAWAARLSGGADVLDVFSHVGGFGLAALASGAASVLAIDSSDPALELARQGAQKSGVDANYQTRKGDAFREMEALSAEGASFDVVVCDPPAFAPSKQALQNGLRAYERAARLAASLVRPGGFLVLCSCSHAADLPRFRNACLRGLARAGRQGVILHSGEAGADHPTHPRLAESAYLKALFLRLA